MQNMMIANKYPIPRKRLVSTNLYVLESRYILSVFFWLFLLLKLSGYLCTMIRRQKTLKFHSPKRWCRFYFYNSWAKTFIIICPVGWFCNV